MGKLIEFLSQMLAVERGGVMLYEKALKELSEDDLRDDLEEFLEETRHHVELCEEMLEQAGGSSDQSSPAADAAESKAEGLVSVEVPEEMADMNNIENLVLAETKDTWNWEMLAEISKKNKRPGTAGSDRSRRKRGVQAGAPAPELEQGDPV
jgi:rubrerythrin